MPPCRIAIIIKLAIKYWLDAAILMCILVTNATIASYEVLKSRKALAALKASLTPEATVKRDGRFVNVDAALVVPGDCALLAAGSAVPADCVVHRGTLQVDDSALTGAYLRLLCHALRSDVSARWVRSTAAAADMDAVVRIQGRSFP